MIKKTLTYRPTSLSPELADMVKNDSLPVSAVPNPPEVAPPSVSLSVQPIPGELQKRVVFEQRNGQWTVDVYAASPEYFISMLDYNRILRLFSSQMPIIRRAANLVYRAAQKRGSVIDSSTKP